MTLVKVFADKAQVLPCQTAQAHFQMILTWDDGFLSEFMAGRSPSHYSPGAQTSWFWEVVTVLGGSGLDFALSVTYKIKCGHCRGPPGHHPPSWWVLDLQTPEGPSFSVRRSSPPIRSPEAVGMTCIAFLEFMADICSQEGYNSPSTEIEFSTALGNDDLQIW